MRFLILNSTLRRRTVSTLTLTKRRHPSVCPGVSLSEGGCRWPSTNPCVIRATWFRDRVHLFRVVIRPEERVRYRRTRNSLETQTVVTDFGTLVSRVSESHFKEMSWQSQRRGRYCFIESDPLNIYLWIKSVETSGLSGSSFTVV